MYNSLGRIGSVRYWSTDAINCYKRGCICEGCPIREMIKSIDRCQMKATVLELVRIHGIPTKRNGPNY